MLSRWQNAGYDFGHTTGRQGGAQGGGAVAEGWLPMVTAVTAPGDQCPSRCAASRSGYCQRIHSRPAKVPTTRPR